MSLRRFILMQLLLIAAVLSLMNGWAIRGLYHWGLDDASEFYLWRDAERAIAHYGQEGRLPEGDALLQFYPALDALPDGYRMAIQTQGWQPEQMGVLSLPDQTVYFLAFPLAENGEPAWVLHRFSAEDDEGHDGLSLSQLALLLLAGSLPPLLLIAFILFRAIARPLQTLSAWAETLPVAGEPQALPASGLRFLELQGLATRLHDAFKLLARQNEREQRFLQTLSHELRTPLAVMRAAVDVLNRREARPEQQGPLARIGRAAQTMTALAESLLWLWRDGGQAPEREELSLRDNLQAQWDELCASGLGAGFVLDNRLPAQATARIAPPLLRIVLSNALRNALSYGQPGVITAEWEGVALCLTNALPPGEQAKSTAPGFGLGLYLVRRIAERHGWAIRCESNAGRFMLSLRLSGEL